MVGRFSFRTKLLAALLGAVSVVLAVTLLVVRQQTAAQVRRVTAQATMQSRGAFEQLEALQQLQLALLGSGFTGSQRTLAALEAALEGGDVQWLAETARYELELRMVDQVLAAFTDAAGTPVVTLIDGERADGDEARIGPLAAALLEVGAGDTLVYRVVRGRLHLLRIQALELGGHVVGTATFGLPVVDADAELLAGIVDAELCFVAGDRCLAGTPRARTEMRAVLTGDAGGAGSRMMEAGNARWLIIADAVPASGPAEAWRVLAVPMDDVLRPFDRIARALWISGLAALLLALALSLVLSRGLARPIRELVAATVRVGRGDYTVRVRGDGRDELGVLARAFNAMTEGLALKERYRGVLDKVVSREIAENLVSGEIRLGGENREVTTLFGDLVSFTTMTDGMEPQDAIALLNECMARLEVAVQEEDGVVDKYIGDEIMAIFGAPTSRHDDAARALAAAVRMQRAMGELNEERTARGDVPLALSIGVHTGEVVAGNMGSPNRLNYTIVGSPVNLAARLCKAAGAGEILVTGTTLRSAGRHLPAGVVARALGARDFKGFSRAVDVYALDIDEHEVVSAAGGAGQASRARMPAVVLAALCALAALVPLRAAAQEGLPTLAGMGLRYTSSGGTVQLDLSGRLDLEGYVPQREPTWLISETDPFLAGRLRMLADLFVGERIYGLAELRVDRGAAPAAIDVEARVEQLFLRVQPLASPHFALQAGKFANPFGAWAARHFTDADPLIRPPLPYDYRTLVAPSFAPSSLDNFLDWRATAGDRRFRGAPVIWDVPYPWGGMLVAGVGAVGARFAATSSAPSSGPAQWGLEGERLRNPTLTAAAGVQLTPELVLGGGWSRGPYLDPQVGNPIPDGADFRDFVQEVFGLDVAFTRGRHALRAEAFFNRWEVPNVPDDPRDISWYAEGSTRLLPGLFAAARYGEIHFNRMGGGTPAHPQPARWDFTQRRLQIGAGYRIVGNAELRAEYSINRTAGTDDPADDLLSIQWWWRF